MFDFLRTWNRCNSDPFSPTSRRGSGSVPPWGDWGEPPSPPPGHGGGPIPIRARAQGREGREQVQCSDTPRGTTCARAHIAMVGNNI
eukprot:9479683-Pyramimonas_sp.AAC.1